MAKTKKKKELSLEEKLEQALVPVDEQPYKIPENWCWVYALNLFDIEYGKGLPTKKLTEEGYPVFGANGQIGFYSEYMYENEKALMSCRGAYSGTMNQSLPKSYVTSNSLIIEDKGRLMLPKYICYMYEALDTSKLVSGSAQPQVTVQAFDKYPVPLPPLAEQQRIVKQIEELFAKLDEAKGKIEDTLDNFKIRKLSVLHKAFSGQLTKKWRNRNLNIEYKREKLQNLTSIIGDGLHGTPCYDEKGEYYFVNGNNFDGKTIKIKADTKTVNEEEFEKHKKNLSDKSTVFVSINGTLGKTAFYNNEPIILGKSACYLNVLPELNKYYLRYYFETEEFMQYANEKATGSTIKNLGLKAMRELQINLPPIDEQEKIVHFLDEILYKEELAKERAEKVLEQIDLIKKSILAKAFRGELGTNNPDEESAVELLKSILSTE